MRLGASIVAAMLAVLVAPAAVGAGGSVGSSVGSAPSEPVLDSLRPVVLRAGGLAITWPLTHPRTSLAPGVPVTIGVRSIMFAQHPGVARIVLLREGKYRGPRLVQRAQLRDGSFTVLIPGGGHYLLRVTVGRWRHQSPIRVSGGCVIQGSPIAATLRLDRATAHVGDTVVATLANAGRGCLTGGLAYGWQYRGLTGWETVKPPPDLAFLLIGLGLGPGAQRSEDVQVWDTMAPGTYRLTKSVTGPGAAPDGGPLNRTIASNTMEVLAP